jgi:hypothetical protein
MDNADAADALDARDERIAELERTAEMYLEGWYKDRRRALTDQPAQDGRGGFHEARPFPHPDSAEAKRRAAKPDQPADAGEPEHRATLAVVPDAYYGWNVTKDSQFLSGPHRSQADAVEAMRKYARADI